MLLLFFVHFRTPRHFGRLITFECILYFVEKEMFAYSSDLGMLCNVPVINFITHIHVFLVTFSSVIDLMLNCHLKIACNATKTIFCDLHKAI